MFRQILFTQFRWNRALVAAMAALAFLVPAIAWWLGGVQSEFPQRPQAFIVGFEMVGPLLMMISTLGAFILAAYPWSMDAASKHVFALSLPVRWRNYLAMRYGAGVVQLLIPTVALWLGALLLLAIIEIPPTLRAYPGTLALRFLTASLVAYSLTFAFAHLTGKRAALVVLLLLVGGATLVFGLRLFGLGAIVDSLIAMLFETPGPFAVFAADWVLIDV